MKLIFPLVCITLLSACNNNSSKNESTGDTVKREYISSDTTHNMPTSGVPELPPVPDGARVYFENLKDGAEVSSPIKVKMATENIKVDTAGPVVSGSGHHHLLIDMVSMSSGEIIPMDSVHLHFGKGQKETEIKLSPGTHKLTLQFADGLHRSYGNKLSSTITVNVKK